MSPSYNSEVETMEARTKKGVAGAVAGAAVGALVGSGMGIAAMGTAIAGTVPLAVIGAYGGFRLLRAKAPTATELGHATGRAAGWAMGAGSAIAAKAREAKKPK